MSSMPPTAALHVVASAELFPLIGSFLSGVPVWTVEYEAQHTTDHATNNDTHEVLSQNARAKRSMGTPGLLPRLAIEHNDLRTLKRLYMLHNQPQFQLKGKFWFTNAMQDAAAIGSLEALQWLQDNTNVQCPKTAMTYAAANGHTKVVRWLLAHRPESHNKKCVAAMELAAKHGHLEVLEILQAHTHGKCQGDVMDRAAANGDLKIVRFLHDNQHGDCSMAAVDEAAINGHFEVVKWLLTSRAEGFTDEAVYGAAVRGHMDILKCLVESTNNIDVLTRGMRKAIHGVLVDGSVEMIEILYQFVPKAFPLFAMTQAVAPGRLAVVQFLFSTGRPPADIDQALKTAKTKEALAIVDYLQFQTLKSEAIPSPMEVSDVSHASAPEAMLEGLHVN